jgi:hypothetical protein
MSNKINKLTLKFLLLLLFAPFSSKAQNSKTAIHVKPYSIAVGTWGTSPFIGTALDFRISERFFLEAGIGWGIEANAAAGFKYYISNPSKRRLNLYTGLYYTTLNIEWAYDSLLGKMDYGYTSGGNSLIVPVGLTYLSKRNFQVNFNSGVIFDEKSITPYFGLNFGFRFGQDLASLKDIVATSNKNFISASLLGNTPTIGVVYERLITPFIGVEAGLGLSSIGFGSKLYFTKLTDLKPCFYVGVSQNYQKIFQIGGYNNDRGNTWKTYFPIGLTRISSNRIRIGLDIGPKINWESYYDLSPHVAINFRIGKAF